MTSEIDYERQQEIAAQGEHVRACMDAIIEDAGANFRNLASLQRRAYKDTEAGISLSFQLDDGTYIYVGTIGGDNASLVDRVRRIGFSSIVEGTDREVAPIWLDLLSDEIDTPEKAAAEYNRIQQETNDEACEIWEQEHAENDNADFADYLNSHAATTS